MSIAVSVILFTAVVAYAIFGGADFGAGFWDLTAGSDTRGRAPRDLIDHAIAPVWEANHTWLIYCLVVLWTAFPTAFAAITTTLYIPLGLAALGIVLRGSGFAFRKVALSSGQRRLNSTVFALSSILTPFFFGTVAGSLASGRVPEDGYGDAYSSWTAPTCLLGGLLAVLVCAYLAAVFLAAEADAFADAELRTWFARRAIVSAVAAGAVSIVGIFVIHADAPRLFHQLSRPGVPALILSVLCGYATLLLLRGGLYRGARVLAVVTVGAVMCGWGVAQYPYLLGTHLTIEQAAAPQPTLWVLVAVACAAALLIVPSLVLLFVLQQRGSLGAHD